MIILIFFSETIGVEVVLENELKIPLTLSNLSLLWTFLPEDENDEEKRVGNEVCGRWCGTYLYGYTSVPSPSPSPSQSPQAQLRVYS